MMSFSQVRAAGGAADYYTNKDNYYVLGSMDERWFGEGANALGLSGAIDKETFTAVLEGKLPDGSDLTRMSGNENKHRAGYDLTFSAPKSVSMMILLGGDKRLIEAHNRAVEGAMREIEKMASVRTMKDGKSETVLTGNLVVALFNHDTSRDQEPQVHTHAVTANATQHEGKWQALSSDTVGKSGFSENVLANQIAAGQIYRHLLAQQTDAMGYEREVVGKHGMWEFKGVPVDAFSSRAKAIDEAVGPDASLKSRDIAALDTRKPKAAIDPEAKMVEWLKTLKETGFDIQAYRSDANSRARTLQVPLPAQLSGDTTALASEAVGKAISQLSERQVQFTWSDLLSKTVSQLPAEPGVVDVARAGLDVAIEKHQLIPLDKEKGIFTSDIHLFDELSISSLSQEISRNGQVSVDASRSIPRSAPYSDAVSVLAQDKSSLAVLSGIGGASVQRERVTEVVAMAQEQGRTVQVLASDNKSQRYLSEDKRLDGLVIPGRNALKNDVAFTPNSTVIVDQAEKYTLKETVVLLDAALRNNVQLIMMDTEQRKGTGNALSVMKEAGVARYQYGKGQQVDVQVISEPDKAQRFGQLAHDYAKAVQNGEESVVQVSGVRNQKELNQQVREALKETDVLGGEDTTIRVLTPVWLDSKSRSSRESYREGMVLERYDSEAKSRERFVIDRVTPRTHSLTLVDPEGKEQVMRLSQLDSSWSLYQSTLMPVAEGEKLRVLAREEQGKLKSGDVLRVGAVNEGHLVVQKQTEHGGLMEKPLKLATGTSPYTALKIAHDYVESPGGSVSDRATVFVATAKQELNTEILNKLARSGKQVALYSALDTEKTTEKLAHHPYYRVVSDQVKMVAGTDELFEAVTQQRDRLHTPAQQAIHLAIPILEGNRLAFSRIKLTAEALEFAEKGTQVDDIQQEIVRQERQGELIGVESAHGFGVDLLVSRNTFETEKSIIRHIAEGKDSLTPLMTPAIGDAPSTLIPTQGLTTGQQKATELILTSRDRFVGIQGYAGVGKTTQFRAVLDALATLPREQQPRVVGLAPTHRAVGEMQSAGVQAQTLASFLHEEDQKLIAGETPNYRNTVFLLDEGSMVGNSDMARAYALIAAGEGRAVISGDVAQLQAISPGQPFKLQQGRSAIDMAVMKEIVRQTPQLREAVYKIIDNDLPGALAVIDSVPPQAVPRREGAWIPENSVLEWQEKAGTGESENLSPQPALSGTEEPTKPGSLYDAIAQDYLGRTDAARDNTLIITHLNSDRQAINSIIHDERHERGELGDENSAIGVLTNTNIPDGELRRLQTWGKNIEAVALLDNTYYRIAGIDGDSQTVALKDDEGRERLISPREAVREGVTLYKAETLSVSVGDKMRFTKSDIERGFVANSVWQVNAISSDGVTLSDGKQTRTLQPERSNEHRHIDLAYAITTHGSQGASETFGIALEGAEGSRKAMVEQASAYVALSRSKQHVQVYTDDKALWLSAIENAKGRSTAHDVMFASQDRDTGTSIRLMGSAKKLDEVALGRNLLKQNGLTGQTLAKYISPSKKFPQPHVALPAFDANGKPAGAWLGAINLTDGQGKVDIPSSGRVLGSDQAQFAALQASQNGETRLAETLSDGARIASSWPKSGVIVRLKGEGVPFNPGAMTGGKVWVDDSAIKTVDVHQDNDTSVLKLPETPEEKQQRELQERAEKAGAEDKGVNKSKDISLPEEKLNEITQSVLNPNQGDKARIPSELLVPSEGSILSPDTRAAVQQVAQENLQRARLQQIEQGMVRDLVKEKTLGGD